MVRKSAMKWNSFAGTKHTLCVLQAFCKVNNKKQRFAGTFVSVEAG